MTNDGYTHLLLTKYSDGLIYKKSWPTADVRICYQQSTPTRWCLAIGINRSYLDESTDTLHSDNDTITRTAQPLSPRLLCNNSMACGQSDGATIQVDIFNTTRRFQYNQRFWLRLDNLMIQWMLQWRDVRKSYNADKKTNSKKYFL